MSTKFFSLTLIVTVLFISCRKELANNKTEIRPAMSLSSTLHAEDMELAIISNALNNLLHSEHEVKQLLKTEMLTNDFENMIPYFMFNDIHFNGESLIQWLYNYRVDSATTLDFFENDVLANFPTLALFVKVDLEDEDDDMAEEWNTSENVNVAFRSKLENSMYGATSNPLEFYSWEMLIDDEGNDIGPDGNYLFWSSFKHVGYVLVNPQGLTFLEGNNPFEEAHDYIHKTTTTLFEEECEEATEALLAFINTTPPNSTIAGVLGWMIHANVLNAMVYHYCEYLPMVSNYGGDVLRSCDRNDRNFAEQITKIQIPNKNDRKTSGLRRWNNNGWEPTGYVFRITYLAVTGSAQSPVLSTSLKTVSVRKKDLSKGKEHSLIGEELNFIQWRLDIFADVMKYAWVSESNSGTTTVSLSNQIGGSFTFQNSGIPSTTTTNSTFSVSHTFNSKAEEAGESLIYYCDQANGDFGKSYSTGRVKFWLKERYNH